MKTLYAWMVLAGILVRYLLSRLGLVRRVAFYERLSPMRIVFARILHWERVRVVHPELCPQEPPAVFVGNHVRLDDPFMAWPVIYGGMREKVLPRYMMRDDFCRGFPWDWMPFRMNDLCEMMGAVLISRDNIQVGQLKRFLTILQEPGVFAMYPGRTRSRSGMLMEYRDGIKEPGGVSFFLAHAQRRRPEARVAAVPLVHTYNIVTRRSTYVFGAPQYLTLGAERAEQRNLDLALVTAFGDLVELQVPHVLSGLLYLHCLHGREEALTVPALVEAVGAVFQAVPDRVTDPAAHTDPHGEIRRALAFLERAGMLRLAGDQVRPDRARILEAPSLDTNYRRRNPVKFLVNQILHLSDVVAAMEAQTLAP